MKIVTVVGARPQFVKAGPVSRALRAAGHQERLVHTGQHYDRAMSDVFFEELGLPAPDVNLGVGSGQHGAQTAAILHKFEEVLLADRPDWVVVFGDTNSTLAAALAAAKLRVPLAHVEAGLRSFNRDMPEEHNRVLTDHCADLLLCPTPNAVELLRREGLTRGVRLVGDPMVDAVLEHRERARGRAQELVDRLRLRPGKYLFATLHRPYTVDDPAVLRRVVGALDAIGEPVVFPVHPRTRARLEALRKDDPAFAHPNVHPVDPVGYLESLRLQADARLVLTDSGGVQKEAYVLGVPCVTCRPETEWVETVEAGWNVLVGSDPGKILGAARTFRPPAARPALFGDGKASEAIARALAAGPG